MSMDNRKYFSKTEDWFSFTVLSVPRPAPDHHHPRQKYLKQNTHLNIWVLICTYMPAN